MEPLDIKPNINVWRDKYLETPIPYLLDQIPLEKLTKNIGMDCLKIIDTAYHSASNLAIVACNNKNTQKAYYNTLKHMFECHQIQCVCEKKDTQIRLKFDNKYTIILKCLNLVNEVEEK